MDAETIHLIITIAVSVLAIVLGVLWFRVQYGRLPATEEELKTAIVTGMDFKKKIEEIIAFFNPEAKMSETPIETIKNVIPANTYQMTEESLNRILMTCADEDEKIRVANTVYEYEHPTTTGEECCIYEIKTSNALFNVQYGVPELVAYDKPVALTQTKIAEIIDLLGEENTFNILWTIHDNEMRGERRYEITSDKGGVIVSNGEYAVVTQN